jgi:hypothetical protein
MEIEQNVRRFWHDETEYRRKETGFDAELNIKPGFFSNPVSCQLPAIRS